MGFVVLHMEKAHGSDSGTTAHIERFIIPKNADPTRTHLNRKLVAYPDGIKDRSAAIQRRLEEAGLTRKIGNNQVRAIRINVSGTHEDMERIEREGRLDEWCADNMKYFADTFGKENIVAAHLHRDEETPHIHVTLVPIVKGERKRRKREEQTKKRYRKKPTDTVRLCADDIMTRLRLKSYQDTYAEAMAKYGLQRGIDGSKARHKSTQQYYNETKKLADSLKAEVVDLQRQKETAQEELKRAKKEIQTEKLKGAATTAAANIAESVGSLFGSNKVKTLERENAALHREVATHGEAIEALQTRIQTMQNDHHRERMELEAKNLSELSRKEAAHTEETTRLKNRILWQNHIIGCLSFLLLKTSDIFRKAVHGIIRLARDYYKPRFDTEQVSDIKSVLNLFGDDKQSHRAAGDFLYITATQKGKLDNREQIKARREVDNVVEGRYDQQQKRGFSMRR
ncbi:MobV family relaxase [uncultured Bacteroides sp.]|uniref:MobV family relaxase n=1 Tax=uncultured Bacteroides sp. TaxID=162156 RepID=UPI0025989D89|nr:MobV family relaxase [uncultured Bacteroides sp.]